MHAVFVEMEINFVPMHNMRARMKHRVNLRFTTLEIGSHRVFIFFVLRPSKYVRSRQK